MDTTHLKRIADAMEEILRLVKADQAQSQAQREKDEEEQSWPTGLGKEVKCQIKELNTTICCHGSQRTMARCRLHT